MKDLIKKWWFWLCSILVLCLLLIGYSYSDNKRITTSTSTIKKETLKTEEEIKANILTEEVGITKNGDYVVKLINNNNEQVYIEDVTVNFFNEKGVFQKKENVSDSFFCIPANSEILTYIWGYEQSFEKYDKSEINISTGKPFYAYYTENFEIKTNDTGEQIAVEVINNNKRKLDCITVNVAFFKDGKIVGIERGISYDEEIDAEGGKAYINIDYPTNSNNIRNKEIEFDKHEIYLTSAYKE